MYLRKKNLFDKAFKQLHDNFQELNLKAFIFLEIWFHLANFFEIKSWKIDDERNLKKRS